MLIARKWKKHYGVANLKLEIWVESRLPGRRLSHKNTLFDGKIPFLWLAKTSVIPPFLKISRLKLQNLLNSCFSSETESSLLWISLEIILLGLSHIVKDVCETWANNPRQKVNSTLAGLFNKSPAGRWTSC